MTELRQQQVGQGLKIALAQQLDGEIDDVTITFKTGVMMADIDNHSWHSGLVLSALPNPQNRPSAEKVEEVIDWVEENCIALQPWQAELLRTLLLGRQS